MKTVEINFERGDFEKFCGYVGENNAVELWITPRSDVASEATFYRLVFESGGGRESTHELFAQEDGRLRFLLDSRYTQKPQLKMQLEGYKENGDYLGKSKICVLFFDGAIGGEELDPALPSRNLAAEVTQNTAARHTHDNMALLNNLGEDGGALTFNGERLGGTCDMQEITAEELDKILT